MASLNFYLEIKKGKGKKTLTERYSDKKLTTQMPLQVQSLCIYIQYTKLLLEIQKRQENTNKVRQ
jgi:hypothetical protein